MGGGEVEEGRESEESSPRMKERRPPKIQTTSPPAGLLTSPARPGGKSVRELMSR